MFSICIFQSYSFHIFFFFKFSNFSIPLTIIFSSFTFQYFSFSLVGMYGRFIPMIMRYSGPSGKYHNTHFDTHGARHQKRMNKLLHPMPRLQLYRKRWHPVSLRQHHKESHGRSTVGKMISISPTLRSTCTIEKSKSNALALVTIRNQCGFVDMKQENVPKITSREKGIPRGPPHLALCLTRLH